MNDQLQSEYIPATDNTPAIHCGYLSGFQTALVVILSSDSVYVKEVYRETARSLGCSIRDMPKSLGASPPIRPYQTERLNLVAFDSRVVPGETTHLAFARPGAIGLKASGSKDLAGFLTTRDDGWLASWVETIPKFRRNGVAFELVSAVSKQRLGPLRAHGQTPSGKKLLKELEERGCITLV